MDKRPQRDRENTLARTSGEGEGPDVEPSLALVQLQVPAFEVELRVQLTRIPHCRI